MKNSLYQRFLTIICVSGLSVNRLEMRKVCARTLTSGNQPLSSAVRCDKLFLLLNPICGVRLVIVTAIINIHLNKSFKTSSKIKTKSCLRWSRSLIGPCILA